jgi:hypothetical protein
VHTGTAHEPVKPVRVDRELDEGEVSDLGGGERVILGVFNSDPVKAFFRVVGRYRPL